MSATLERSAPQSPIVPGTSNREFLTYDRADFLKNYSQRPFLIQHAFSDHPLFQLPRLMELARSLNEKHIEYNGGDLPVNQDPALTPRNGLSPEATIQRIEECQSWLVLKYVENDPEYRALLDSCLNQIRPLTEQLTPGMMKPHAFIFITSPGSVTPYHMDPEHNFLLQVRGSKTVHMFDGRDRSIVSERDLEQFYGTRSRHMILADENRDKKWVIHLESGKGLHFPVTYPHWVQNGLEVSVSFSITFRTPDLDQRRGVYSFNAGVRKYGMTPVPRGVCSIRDGFKYQTTRLYQKIQGLFKQADK